MRLLRRAKPPTTEVGRSKFGTFGGLNGPRPPVDSFNPSAFPRRLTTETLATLRRRRAGAARGMCHLLQRERREGDASDDDEGGDESDEEGGGDLCDEFCCCWGPRCCIASCMLIMTLMGWSTAITYGILQQPTYEQVVRPVRVARQHYLSKYYYGAPKTADDGFILFDRDADGFVSVRDMKAVAFITTGERPTEEQLKAYIARGDADGDGQLDEVEYLALLHSERAQKAAVAAGDAMAGWARRRA